MSTQHVQNEQSAHANIRRLNDLGALQRLHQVSMTLMHDCALREFEDETALERQDAALSAQLLILETTSKVKSKSMDDVLAKFGIWMEDFAGSDPDPLSTESHLLISSIFSDLQTLADQGKVAKTA